MSYVTVTVGVAVNKKTYVRKLKDMTCFKGAMSRFAHLEKTSLLFSSSVEGAEVAGGCVQAERLDAIGLGCGGV